VVHTGESNKWHMQELATICAADAALLTATAHREVDLSNETDVANAVEWWETAIKVRGREYLRIVYGPEYALPDNLNRLRERAVAGKRRLAMQEFT
jgi:protein phosphatase